MSTKTKIRGITIELDGDMTGLKKSLKDVNGSIYNTQKQLKDVERLLKMDPGNTELIRQKYQLLEKSIAENEEKLKSLKKAEEEVQKQFQEGKISQEQYDALQREIIATENELERLEIQAEEAGNALNGIDGKKLEKVASAAENVANKTKLISAAAGGAVAGMVGMAVKAGKAADDLNTLAKQSGFSTDQIQKWEYASDRIDVSVDDIVSSAKKMKKNMISTSSEVTNAWATLGVSVKDANGDLRDSNTVFEETVLALSKVQNETERDTLAMTLFGKSADSLAGIIDDGGAALQQFGEEAEEAGLILSQDTLDSANEFNDAIDELKAKATGTFAEVGTEIAEMLLPYLDDISNMIENVLSWIKNLDEDQLKMIMTILMVVAAISPMAKGLSSLITIITFMSGTVIPALGAAFSFIAANPIVLLIAAIVALVAIIATKGDEIQERLQKVDDFLQGVFTKDWTEQFGVLGNILNGFFDIVKTIWDSIKLIFDGIIDFIRGIFTKDWERAWGGVKKIFKGVFDGLTGIAKAPINGIIAILNGAISGINKMISGINKIKVDVPSWVPLLGGRSLGFNIRTIGKIPYLADGGVLSRGSAIVGEAGPELLTMQGNSAVVQPLTNHTRTTNMGGINITIYSAPGQNVEELAELVSEKISDTVARQEAVFA